MEKTRAAKRRRIWAIMEGLSSAVQLAVAAFLPAPDLGRLACVSRWARGWGGRSLRRVPTVAVRSKRSAMAALQAGLGRLETLCARRLPAKYLERLLGCGDTPRTLRTLDWEIPEGDPSSRSRALGLLVRLPTTLSTLLLSGDVPSYAFGSLASSPCVGTLVSVHSTMRRVTTQLLTLFVERAVRLRELRLPGLFDVTGVLEEMPAWKPAASLTTLELRLPPGTSLWPTSLATLTRAPLVAQLTTLCLGMPFRVSWAECVALLRAAPQLRVLEMTVHGSGTLEFHADRTAQIYFSWWPCVSATEFAASGFWDTPYVAKHLGYLGVHRLPYYYQEATQVRSRAEFINL